MRSSRGCPRCRLAAPDGGGPEARTVRTCHTCGTAPAAAALHWAGELVTDVRLFGTRIAAVLIVDQAAHTVRQGMGCAAAELDPATLAIWEWPEGRDAFPPTVAALVGVLVPVDGRGARRAVATARGWSGFCSSAVLLDDTTAATEDLRLECVFADVALVAADPPGGATLIQPGQVGRAATARRTTLDRWVEEQMYGRLLADGVLDTEPTRLF